MDKKAISLSVTIITLNEEGNLKECLESVKQLSAEVILVDSGSSDKTVEIAKNYGAKVFHRIFDNFANQKNYAMSQANGKWIFSIDADERVTQTLANEIKKVTQENIFYGFLIPRKNYILGKEIRYSRWNPDTHVWLWKKECGKWVGIVHEEVVVGGHVGQLKEAKIHYQDETVKDFINTLNGYSNLEAIGKLKKGERFSFIKMVYDGIMEFGIRFVYKQGFRDGWRGFVLSTLMGIYKFMVWLKILELQN